MAFAAAVLLAARPQMSIRRDGMSNVTNEISWPETRRLLTAVWWWQMYYYYYSSTYMYIRIAYTVQLELHYTTAVP